MTLNEMEPAHADRLILLDFLHRILQRAIATNDSALIRYCNDTLAKLERKTVFLTQTA
jgi:hypothetical protein